MSQFVIKTMPQDLYISTDNIAVYFEDRLAVNNNLANLMNTKIEHEENKEGRTLIIEGGKNGHYSKIEIWYWSKEEIQDLGTKLIELSKKL